MFKGGDGVRKHSIDVAMDNSKVVARQHQQRWILTAAAVGGDVRRWHLPATMGDSEAAAVGN